MPELNLVPDSNRGVPHPAQAKTPARFSPLRRELPGRSVPALRRTR